MVACLAAKILCSSLRPVASLIAWLCFCCPPGKYVFFQGMCWNGGLSQEERSLHPFFSFSQNSTVLVLKHVLLHDHLMKCLEFFQGNFQALCLPLEVSVFQMLVTRILKACWKSIFSSFFKGGVEVPKTWELNRKQFHYDERWFSQLDLLKVEVNESLVVRYALSNMI